jgi:hypothetical protein
MQISRIVHGGDRFHAVVLRRDGRKIQGVHRGEELIDAGCDVGERQPAGDRCRDVRIMRFVGVTGDDDHVCPDSESDPGASQASNK